jgi:hypothetical protein
MLGQTTIQLNYQLTIQPIFLQNGPAGATAVHDSYASLFEPSNSVFKEVTQQIWAQAHVQVTWLAPRTFTSATYYAGVLDAGALDNLASTAFTPGNQASSDPNTMNMWFVGTEGSVLGLSKQTQTSINSGNPGPGAITRVGNFGNGVTISESVFSGSHYDTIAHEIGHNLGLNHADGDGSGSTALNNTFLMSQFATGVTLTEISALTASGGAKDNFLTGEVNYIGTLAAQNNFFDPALLTTLGSPVTYTFHTISAVPEPQDAVLIFGAAVGVFGMVRRRIASRISAS